MTYKPKTILAHRHWPTDGGPYTKDHPQKRLLPKKTYTVGEVYVRVNKGEWQKFKDVLAAVVFIGCNYGCVSRRFNGKIAGPIIRDGNMYDLKRGL